MAFIEVDRKDVEAVKLALKAAMRKGVPARETLIGSIDFLTECYGWSEDERYLLSAMASLQAYLELGFAYEDYREKFDQLMGKLGTFRELQFAGQYFPVAVIPQTKSRIKTVIGPWSTSKYHTMPIAEVLEDILEKVINGEVGRYEYHSNMNTDSRKDHVFELLISEDARYLHDVQKDQYYLLL
ncbi:MAG: hypothetical protein IJZ85_00760 [Lachnospiraceae bacterium]|nr:hypothetical protein [Lachnospiraceae bacterium]